LRRWTATSPRLRRDLTAEKVVYSRTLDAACTNRTRIEREFDPRAVRRLKESVASDLLIGGAELAVGGFAAGLIDECHIFLAPVLVGAGKRCWPERVRVVLELLEERHFGNGWSSFATGRLPES
jgi:dihydrofolate reductase